MKSRDKHHYNTGLKDFDSNEGERRCLSRNNTGTRSPSLDFTPFNESGSDEDATEHLASILVGLFLYLEANPYAKQKCRDLLSRLNQGTSGRRKQPCHSRKDM